MAPDAALLAAHIAAAERATVGIESWAPYVGWRRVGSGVAISGDGLVLTAHHVVDGPGRYRIGDSRGEPRRLRVVARDPERDLAIVDTGEAFDAHLVMAADAVEAGAWLVGAGYPGRAAADPDPVASVGLATDADRRWIVAGPEPSRLDPDAQPAEEQVFEHMLSTSCASAAGMSGGPVIDLDGALVGVIVGAGGVVSPVALSGELPRRVGRRLPPRRDAAASPGSEPSFVRDEVGRPDRHLTLLAGLPETARRAARSLVELRREDLDLEARGVAVAPDRVLTVAAIVDGGAPALIRASDETDERVATEVLAVRGELALLRVLGVDDLVPRGADVGSPVVGAPVITLRWGEPSVGIVTDDAREPGRIDAPPFGDRGCGWLRGRARRENPPIDLGRVFVHDTLGFARGALLVDRRGRPVGIDVGSADDDLHYAVPIADALTRFE